MSFSLLEKVLETKIYYDVGYRKCTAEDEAEIRVKEDMGVRVVCYRHEFLRATGSGSFIRYGSS